MSTIRYDKLNLECELDDDEIEMLAKIFQTIKGMRQSFKEYVEQFKKDEVEKFLNAKKAKEAGNEAVPE